MRQPNVLATETGAVRELAQLLADPIYGGAGVPRGDGRPVVVLPGLEHLQARGYWRPYTLPSGKQVKIPGPFVRLAKTPIEIRRQAPEPGEHAAEVLKARPEPARSHDSSCFAPHNAYPRSGDLIGEPLAAVSACDGPAPSSPDSWIMGAAPPWAGASRAPTDAQRGSTGVTTPRRASIASAASRQRSSR